MLEARCITEALDPWLRRIGFLLRDGNRRELSYTTGSGRIPTAVRSECIKFSASRQSLTPGKQCFSDAWFLCSSSPSFNVSGCPISGCTLHASDNITTAKLWSSPSRVQVISVSKSLNASYTFFRKILRVHNWCEHVGG